MDLPELTTRERQRYSRHLLLPEIGEAGQQRLKRARVLCVGAGGLGSPAALYLAAAGVGTLGLIDFDVVDFSNLQRQIIHGTADVGRSKLASARARIAALNPEVQVETFEARFSQANAQQLVEGFDVILDGTDNFPARYLVNDACVLFGRPNAWGSIFRFEGQASVFAAPGGPCYRCLHPEPPPDGLVPSCAEAGVLGVLPGVIGTIQATEALKLILGIGEPLIGRFLVYDALKMRFRDLKLRKDPDCPICGTRPTITDLRETGALCETAKGVRPGSDPFLTSRELKARIDAGTRPIHPGRPRAVRSRDLQPARLDAHPARRAPAAPDRARSRRRNRRALQVGRPERPGRLAAAGEAASPERSIWRGASSTGSKR